MCRIPPRRVELDLRAILKEISGVERRMSTEFLSAVSVFLNTLDGPIPTITVIAFDESRDSLTFLGGGGAWSTKERALTQALFEAGQCRSVLRTLEGEPRQKIRPESSRKSMGDFLDATIYYGYRENRALLDWYSAGKTIGWADVPSWKFATLDEEWNAVMEWLVRGGLNPVIVDLDSACWPAATVLKVIVPELTSACVPAEPFLGHPRYYGMPGTLGLASRPLKFEDLNDQPLPFP
jgi:ribosomal protein S12 methylthiotransferase accessory factor